MSQLLHRSVAVISFYFRFMKNGDLPQRMKSARDLVARIDLSERELLAVAVLMFWSTGSIDCV